MTDAVEHAKEIRRRIVAAGLRAQRERAERETYTTLADVERERLRGIPAAAQGTRRAIYEVLAAHGVAWADIVSRARHPHTQPPRRAVYAVLRELGWSYPAIARFCGRKCHSSIMHATDPARREKRKHVRATR